MKLVDFFPLAEALHRIDVEPLLITVQSWIHKIPDQRRRGDLHILFNRFVESEPGSDEARSSGSELWDAVTRGSPRGDMEVAGAINKLMKDKMSR